MTPANGATPGTENAANVKILVVERDAAVRHALSKKLHAAGYTVLMAAGASGAIKALCEQNLDLILLDLGVPDQSAHARGVSWEQFLVISWRSAFPPGVPIPFIAVSSDPDHHQRDWALAAGAVEFLDLSADQERFRSAIERAVSSAPAQSV